MESSNRAVLRLRPDARQLRQGLGRLLVHAPALGRQRRAVAGLGPGAGAAAAAPGQGPGAGPLADDRLHRRLPRHPAAARRPDRLRQLRRRCPGRRPPARRSASRASSGSPTPSGTACIAITITYGAYMAEVYRAGIEAVPHGQMEAARSLGMSHAQAMRYVIVPQAIRKVIPPLLNDFIALMKDTSLVSVIGAARGGPGRPRHPAVEFNSSALTLGALMFLRRHDPARAARRLADRARSSVAPAAAATATRTRTSSVRARSRRRPPGWREASERWRRKRQRPESSG